MAPNCYSHWIIWLFCLSLTSVRVVTAQTTRDSAGVRIVRYERGATPSFAWKLSPRPLLEIAADGGEHTEFTNVRGVARLSNGRVAVANGGSNEIRIFSAQGTFERTLGRAGGGPGEFTRLVRLLRWGDTLAGVDGDSRAQVFTPMGDLVRSLRPARSARAGNPQRIGTSLAGSTFVVVTEGTSRNEREGAAVLLTLTIASLAGDSLIAVETLPSYRMIRVGGAPSRLLFDAEGVIAASGTLSCHAHSSRFDITCRSRGERTPIRVVREVATRDVREEERALVRKAYLDANLDAPAAIRQQMQRAVNDFRFAERAPVFSRLVLSTSDELWVGPFDPGHGLPGAAASRVTRTAQRWSVFSAKGTWLSDVVLPPRFVPLEMGPDYVAGVAFDADDVERVVVWRLTRDVTKD